MGNRCYYHPLAGPPGATGAGGICPDCADHEVTSYFCSSGCYQYNLVSDLTSNESCDADYIQDIHREDFHYRRGIQNDADRLERFRPASDLEIVS